MSLTHPRSERAREPSSVYPIATLVAVRRWLARRLAALTWRRVLGVALFCSVYGFVLSLDPTSGGAAVSIAAYLSGDAAALKLLLPAVFMVTVAASFAPMRLLPRAVTLVVAVTIGVAVGYCLMTGLQELIANWHTDRLDFFTWPLQFFALGWLGVAVYLLAERDQSAKQTLHEEMQQQFVLERLMSETQLQVLQSQVEPHFLFNTLAHVRRLYRTDPPAARMMMRNLAQYLGVALPPLRHNGIALGEDADLAIAYLNLHKVRMGPRLTFEFDIPTEAKDVQVPPMMITTLVENAIKHGLSPLPEGGMIRISVTSYDDRFVIETSDTGQGLQETIGTGVGLANIRARLSILYGAGAALALSSNRPSGVVVTVTVPRLQQCQAMSGLPA